MKFLSVIAQQSNILRKRQRIAVFFHFLKIEYKNSVPDKDYPYEKGEFFYGEKI
jgi:hypothetical protein